MEINKLISLLSLKTEWLARSQTTMIFTAILSSISLTIFIFYASRKKWLSSLPWLSGLIIFSGLFLFSGSYQKTPNIQPITENMHSDVNFGPVLKAKTNDEIRQNLIMLTNKSNSGPMRNYYWNAGDSQIGNLNLDIGTVKYSHDSQGRSSVAQGKLTYDMYQESKGSRQGIPLNPPFWPRYNPKVAIHYSLGNRTYHGYMYNRSHSIADSLAGTASYTSKYNFTTGTRPQNVGADQNGGMRAAEEIAEGYWQEGKHSTNAYINYQVTPIYNGNETISRGSIVDIKSSDGHINRRVVVINDAEGYIINYNNGQISKK